jgi:hypothetical protein
VATSSARPGAGSRPAVAPPPNRDPRPQARSNDWRPGTGNRAPSTPRGDRPWRGKPGTRGASRPAGGPSDRGGADHDILFQKFFKSIGPRTYAAQVKRAKNGNHYLVLMEGKRDDATADVRKTRLFVYSEDFVEFFRLVKSAAEFIKANPLPRDVQDKRDRYWSKQAAGAPAASAPAASSAPRAAAIPSAGPR